MTGTPESRRAAFATAVGADIAALAGNTLDDDDAEAYWAALESSEDGRYVPEPPDVRPVSSWARHDLAAVLDGSYVQPEPTLMARSDGACLLYPGLVHSLHGESESGKSLLAQIESARLIAAGLDVLFIDFESDAASVAQRLVTFGATPEQILRHFHYYRPDVAPRAGDDLAAWEALLTGRYALAVIDGVTDALGVYGFETNSNDGVSTFMRALPKVIAERTGAAVALIDHVTKDADTRGRFAIGGQAKLSSLTGAAYSIEVVEVLGRGLRGVIVVRVGKDRPGSVRPRCGLFRKSDRTQEAARVTIDSTDPDRPIVTVDPPREAPGDDGQAAPFRPTVLMERVSRAVEANPQISQRSLYDAAKGKETAIIKAVSVLAAEGFITVEVGPRKTRMHTSVKPYRQATDPGSDRFDGAGVSQTENRPLTDARPYTGGRASVSQPTPGVSGASVGVSRQSPRGVTS